MHVLMLPLVSGQYVGGTLNNMREVPKLRKSFFEQVGKPAGLKYESAKLRGQSKQWAIDAVIKVCGSLNLPAANGPLWPLFQSGIERDPTPYMLALDIDPNSIRPSGDMVSKPIGIASNPIGIGLEGSKHQSLSCVGIAIPTTSKEAKSITPEPLPTREAEAIETMSDLWARVGCQSKWLTPSPIKVLIGTGSNHQNAIRLQAATKSIDRVIHKQRQQHALPELVVTSGDVIRERDPEFLEALRHGW